VQAQLSSERVLASGSAYQSATVSRRVMAPALHSVLGWAMVMERQPPRRLSIDGNLWKCRVGA